VPEGHTIHRLARDLSRDLRARQVSVRSPQGRFADGAARLDGQTCQNVRARGKHLFINFSDDTLHIHLGLIGKFRRWPHSSHPGDSIRLHLSGEDSTWHLSGPQDCRIVSPAEVDDITDRLGPDPLARGAKPDRFIECLKTKRTPIGAVLLDQTVIAGIGNVYRAELLFLHNINPRVAAGTLSSDEAVAIWNDTRDLLKVGVRLNRIVTVTDSDSGTTRGRLRDPDRLYVYKRENLPCRRCGTAIATSPLNGRNVWWCPACQP
jgi:endonuclease VIII